MCALHTSKPETNSMIVFRLVLTLRFLATGESYRSLMFSFRIPVSTISSIIPETCEAIYECLKDIYMKVG